MINNDVMDNNENILSDRVNANYRCLYGKLIGEETIECVNGNWNNKPPICKGINLKLNTFHCFTAPFLIYFIK